MGFMWRRVHVCVKERAQRRTGWEAGNSEAAGMDGPVGFSCG